MNMVEISALVLALTSSLCLHRLVVMRRQNTRQRKIIRQLERTIGKLNTKNGRLWYRMSQTETPDFSGDVTEVTSTKY